ncbi:MAG: class A beta-lactamase-related serine hydrolase [Chitinophagaceae bacterium]|nr:MAG: class A beta-lactamase-related serine hydrolase [Chitinophagaceae bacterium]
MTYKIGSNCLLFSFFISCLLMLQPAFSQSDWKATDLWLKKNINSFGGRAILLVVKEGMPVYTKVLDDMGPIKKGIAARKGISNWNEHSVVPVASASKWLSAALVMTFVDEGKLRLSDTVGLYLPILSEKGKGNITISDCLSHLTGTGSRISENREYSRMASMDQCIRYIAAKPMHSEPGEAFYYGSDGLQIAAAILETISGKKFETLFGERIAGPLGMMNTTFGSGPVALAAGGARSTVSDYMKFLLMILNEGKVEGKQILTAASVKEMQENRISGKVIAHSPDETRSWGYGFGEWVVNEHIVSSPGLFGTFPWINSKEKYAAILFTFNLKFKGRHDKYRELIRLVDEAVK